MPPATAPAALMSASHRRCAGLRPTGRSDGIRRHADAVRVRARAAPPSLCPQDCTYCQRCLDGHTRLCDVYPRGP